MRKANSGALIAESDQPIRCLTVTGMDAGKAARTALDDDGRQRRLTHESRAARARGDFARGTAHVDVDHASAGLSRHLRRARQHLGLATDNLHDEASATQAGPHAPHHPFRPAGERLGRQEFGEGQGRPMLLADGAERQVCHRLHGREQSARADFDGADTHREGETIARPRGATPALPW